MCARARARVCVCVCVCVYVCVCVCVSVRLVALKNGGRAKLFIANISRTQNIKMMVTSYEVDKKTVS